MRQAVADVLAERGWRRTTVEAVAARAGVARTTVYRRYGSVHGVLLLLMGDIYGQVPVPDTGSLRGDLIVLMRDVVAVWRDPAHVRYLSALIAAQHENADLALAHHEQFEHRRAATSTIIARAVERGDLAVDADGDLLLDLLGGIIAERVLFRRLTLADDFPETVVTQLLAGFAPRP
ncbi:MAG: TetR/AcrR family transcriptional regulator C-terminal ligand-binding domain-containing protein [Actinomycetota bacterium]|nr:TetR/AcrR family transcriptional regulator C-terminal ligand-binding domain-containing protein [Actinomycetota bacterium]